MAARRTATRLSSTTGMLYESGLGSGQIVCTGLNWRAGNQQLLADQALDGACHFRVVFQVLGRIGLALTDLVALIAVPGTGLLQQAVLHAEVDDLAIAVDALAVEDLEFGLAER